MNTRTHKDLDVEALEADLDAVEVNPDDAIDAAPLRDLADLVSARTALENQITATISKARTAGLSWGYIAEVLGVSRQAARQKYDSLISEAVKPDLTWATVQQIEGGYDIGVSSAFLDALRALAASGTMVLPTLPTRANAEGGRSKTVRKR